MLGHNLLQFANHNAQLYGFDLSGRFASAKANLRRFICHSVGGSSYTRGPNLDTGGKLYGMMP